MADVRDVAEYIIIYAINKGRPVKNLDLQKIMYFCHAKSLLVNVDNPLIDNANIQKWRYGPVFPEIYRLYKTNGAMAIQSVKRRMNTLGEFTEFDINNNSIECSEKKLINEVVENLTKSYKSFELVEETHKHPQWLCDEEQILNGVQGLRYTNEGIYQDFSEHQDFRIWSLNNVK